MAATAAAADDARVAAHFAAISPYLGADALPCTTLVDRAGTATLMPPRCFQCGMLLNNKQTWYERHKPHMEPLALFEHMHMTMDCCRINISRAAADPRLHHDPPFQSTLVTITRASRLEAPATTMPTDGSTRVFYAARSS